MKYSLIVIVVCMINTLYGNYSEDQNSVDYPKELKFYNQFGKLLPEKPSGNHIKIHTIQPAKIQLLPPRDYVITHRVKQQKILVCTQDNEQEVESFIEALQVLSKKVKEKRAHI